MVFNINLSQLFNRDNPNQPSATTTAFARIEQPADESTAVATVNGAGTTALAIVDGMAQSVGSALVAVVPGAVANKVITALATLGPRELSVVGDDLSSVSRPMGTEMVVFTSGLESFKELIMEGICSIVSTVDVTDGDNDNMMIVLLFSLLALYFSQKNALIYEVREEVEVVNFVQLNPNIGPNGVPAG